MGNGPNVQLEVREGAPPDSSWTTSGDYCYRYRGGSDGQGNVDVKLGNGRTVIPLRLVADARFALNGAEFASDQGQLRWNGNSPNAGTIIDENTAEIDAKYTMKVLDTQRGLSVDCDPAIRNQPH